MGGWRDHRRFAAGLALAVVAAGLFAGAPAGAKETPVQILRRLGIPAGLAKRAARHMPLGLPGLASLKDEKNLLLVRNGYIISFNTERNAANFALAIVEESDLGDVPRQRWMQHPRTGEDVQVFRPEPTFKDRFYKPTLADFLVDKGYTRGHIIRSRERSSSVRENRKTFVYTNMLVQAGNVNNGPWQAFEDFYLDYAHEHGLVPSYVIGEIWGKPPIEGNGHVAIASEHWKVVTFLRPGQTADTVDETNRVIAIRIPNSNELVKTDDSWTKFRVTPGEIESATGLDLFSLVRPHIAEKLRKKVDTGVTTAPKAPQADLSNTPLMKQLQAGVIGTLKSFDSEKHRGLVTLPNGHDIFVHADELSESAQVGGKVRFDLAIRRDGQRVALQVKQAD